MTLLDAQRITARNGAMTVILRPTPFAIAWVNEVLPSGRVLTTEVR